MQKLALAHANRQWDSEHKLLNPKGPKAQKRNPTTPPVTRKSAEARRPAKARSRRPWGCFATSTILGLGLGLLGACLELVGDFRASWFRLRCLWGFRVGLLWFRLYALRLKGFVFSVWAMSTAGDFYGAATG